ncbi:MAG TPA: patatin-like phospholipase family protein [Caulobacteraceae bacterium]
MSPSRKATEARPATPGEAPPPPGIPFDSVALLLQGGGALGSYQAGVYQALVEHGVEPTWLCGISIGAINSAIIAGNPAGKRVAKLREFWELISAGGQWNNPWLDFPGGEIMRGIFNQVAAGGVLVQGVPGFFSPQMPPAPLQPKGAPGATSWYDTSALKSTLERLVDFDRINHGAMRFSVGAVNVRTGNFAYFDTTKDTIRVEHVMASGALPPAFPAVEIDGEFYWDGGMVSNTPLDWVLSSRKDVNTLILQVDLWSARGQIPADLAEVGTRMKDIQYSSRTRAATDEFQRRQKLRAALYKLMHEMPPELAQTPEARLLTSETSPAAYNIVQLIYRSATYESQSKDYEFSRATMEEHWQAGYGDARTTLDHPEVLALPPEPSQVRVFDCLRPPSG